MDGATATDDTGSDSLSRGGGKSSRREGSNPGCAPAGGLESPGRQMSTRDDDILDFDFFEEKDVPSWEEPEGQGGEEPPPRDRGRCWPDARQGMSRKVKLH